MVSVGSNLVTKIDMQYYTSPSGVKCKNQEQKKRNRNCHPIWQYQSPCLTVPYRRLVLSYHPFGTVKFRHRQKKQPGKKGGFLLSGLRSISKRHFFWFLEIPVNLLSANVAWRCQDSAWYGILFCMCYSSPRRKSHFYAPASMPAQKVAENFSLLKFSLGFMAHPCATFVCYSSPRRKSIANCEPL